MRNYSLGGHLGVFIWTDECRRSRDEGLLDIFHWLVLVFSNVFFRAGFVVLSIPFHVRSRAYLIHAPSIAFYVVHLEKQRRVILVLDLF